MNAPSETLIISNNKYGKKTITGYKKTDVKKKLEQSIHKKEIELSIMWCTELHCSGCIKDIFNIIIKNAGELIDSPTIYFMIDKYLDKYDIINNLFKKSIDTRNNQEVRNFLIDLMYILCSSNRTMMPLIKIEHLNEYTIYSKNKNFVNTIRKPDDSRESIMAINEILVLLDNRDRCKFDDIVFWYFWLEKMETKNKHQKLLFCDNQRLVSNGVLSSNFRWFIWEAILNYSTRTNKQIQFLIQTMYNCYVYKLTKGIMKKRYFIIIRALHLLFDQKVVPIIKVFSERLQVCCNSNLYYKEIRTYVDNHPEEETKLENTINIEDKIEKIKEKIEKKKEKEINMEYLFDYNAVKNTKK